MLYTPLVPDKEASGFERLITKNRTDGVKPVFTCFGLRASSLGGGDGEAFGLAGFLLFFSPVVQSCYLPPTPFERGKRFNRIE